MGVKRKVRNLMIIFVVLCLVATSAGTGQECFGPEGYSQDDRVPAPVPEFPTLAVPAGLLVGMVYIIFLIKNKGRKNSFFQQK